MVLSDDVSFSSLGIYGYDFVPAPRCFLHKPSSISRSFIFTIYADPDVYDIFNYYTRRIDVYFSGYTASVQEVKPKALRGDHINN